MSLSSAMKKAIFPLITAAAVAAASGGICLFTAKTPVNAAAVVCFKAQDRAEGPVNTEISRSVSALRRAVLSEELLERAASASGITKEELEKAVSVERMEGSQGAVITLNGLESPSYAPIILANLLYGLSGDQNVPEFEIISDCDMINEPKFPYISVCAGAGLAGGLLCFVLLCLDRKEKEYYRTEKADSGRDYYRAVNMQEYIENAYRSAAFLGGLPLSTPEGLEKSGYSEAAEHILSGLRNCVSKIIAVSPDYSTDGEGTPSRVKVTAYLSCAFAEKGLRTAVIDCDLKNPAVGKIFGAEGKGGAAEITEGSCTVWDALVINARKGVDIIAQPKPCTEPVKVFSSSSFSQLLLYLSSQYDIMLLYCPKAWDCPEWELIERFCTGAVIVTDESKGLSAEAAKGILKKELKFTAIAVLEK